MRVRHGFRLALALGCLGVLVSSAAAVVPQPAETPCEVVVSGPTSTLKSITIVSVGQEIPKTYSGSRVHNTPGFSWWVSRHYALKTDYPKEMAEFYLTLLELAYPHYVNLFGREPEGIEDTRMTVIYASIWERIHEVLRSDGLAWVGGSGGVTFERVKAAYQVQIYDVEHVWDQPRYIVIHECVHLFQSCAAGSIHITPVWYLEGVADRLANHVYDSSKKRLTVNVFDKAGPIYLPQEGVERFRGEPNLTLEGQTISMGYGRDTNVLACAFFNSTPDRMQKFRLWRDAMFAKEGTHVELIEKIFGPWERLNAEFREWVGERRLTFSAPGRQWSQDADTLWAFNSPPGSDQWSYMDVFLAPGEKPQPDPWRLDHPGSERPSLVGPVERGVPEPSVGCEVDFSKGPREGRAGFGMGVIEAPPQPKEGEPAGDGPKPGCLKVLLDAAGSLVIDGDEIDFPGTTLPLPEAIKQAMAAGGHRAGITAKIGRKELVITVRARDPKAEKDAEFVAAVPLMPAQRQRLLHEHLALLAQGGWHGVTHFFDPGRVPLPDLTVPASPDPWRNPGDKQLYSLYRAERALGDRAPASLVKLKRLLLDAADKDPPAQQAALETYRERLPQVAADVRALKDESLASAGLAELLGVSMAMAFDDDATLGEPKATVRITGPVEGDAAATVRFEVAPAAVVEGTAAETALEVKAGKSAEVTWEGKAVAEGPTAFRVTATATVMWRGVPIALKDSVSAYSSVPRWMIIGPFDNKGDGTVDTPQPIETEPIDLGKKYVGKGDAEVAWQPCIQDASAKLPAEHIVHYDQLYGGENVAAYALVWVESPEEQDAVLALGSDDGVVVWLNGERVHANLVGRGYRSREDKVPVRLRKGRNQLLVKVMQGNGGWAFAAHLLDKSGRPLEGITYSLAAE
ncbi:MAG TPA: hypothetical protein VMY69_02010 [Phycisphaerae bacterium]|nr:hypothetical protein [Phycisphaerae bacterium]